LLVSNVDVAISCNGNSLNLNVTETFWKPTQPELISELYEVRPNIETDQVRQLTLTNYLEDVFKALRYRK